VRVSVQASAAKGTSAAGALAVDALPFAEGEARTFAGGVKVSGRELNEGYRAYTRYCRACHGEAGDGKGPAAMGLWPPPRDFTKGVFKFARQRSSDDVPNDEDLRRIVKGGLGGSAMLAWDVPEPELGRVIQYVKSFVPKKWEKKKRSGEPVPVLEAFSPGPDPWAGKEEQARQRGRALYHLKAECSTCHPAYGGRRELYEMSLTAAQAEPGTFAPIRGYRDDMYGAVPKRSEEYGVTILPPDFLWSELRSVQKGREVEDLFRVISFGVYPVMPAWKGALPDEDLWAIAHYVASLVALRDTPAAWAMRDAFAKEAGFSPPRPQ